MGKRRITEKLIYKDYPVIECGFCNRTYLALRRNNINDLYSLIHRYNNGDIIALRGIGKMSRDEIEDYFLRNFLGMQE